ncbi:hypothetical protein PLESTM_001475300 [Pleodorina starrii]|nr:hypothetical protein PLESTM_001475300 [Pleodorina starrii]
MVWAEDNPLIRMDLADDDVFALFNEQPQSPGVTSLLRHCIGDDNDFGEVSSVISAEYGQVTGPGSEGAEISLPFPSRLSALSEAQTFAQHTQLQLAQGESRAPLIGETSGMPLPGFSLGTNFPAIMSTKIGYAGEVAVARRRGRKPKPRLPDLQQRLDGLQEQFKQLSNENIFLRNKLKVLERVVPYRDESVGFLTQLLSSVPAAAARASGRTLTQTETAAAAGSVELPREREQSPSASGDAADSNSSGSGLSAATPGTPGEAQSSHAPAVSGSTEGTAGSTGARVGTASGGRCLMGNTAATGIAAFTSLASSDIAAPGIGRMASGYSQPQQHHGSGQSGSSPGTPAVLALCPSPDGDVPAITLAALEELKRVTAQEFRLLWKHICLQLGVLVTGAEVHGPGSSPYIRLERFLERALSYMDKITLLSPACFVHSMYMNVETGQPERPSDSFWITCARALQLSQQQLREVTSLAAVYEQNVVPVVQQRLQLSMQLSTRLAAATGPQRGGSSSSSDALTVRLSVDELAEQLERNVLKEHQTHWNIGDFLCSSVLTPMQVAKALSIAYPYIPDGVAMLHAFKLISAQDDAAAAAASQRVPAPNPNASQPQTSANPQPFPSIAGLLASQLPALAAGLMVGAGQAQAPRGMNTIAALQQQAAGGGGGVGQMAAALAKLAAGLPPVQLQQMLAAVAGVGMQQTAQFQPLLAGLQGAALAARTTQPPAAAAMPVAAAAVPRCLPAAAPPQLQGLTALLGALAAAQQTAVAHSAAHVQTGAAAGSR